MKVNIPPPPDLKPTIIQMQSTNSINNSFGDNNIIEMNPDQLQQQQQQSITVLKQKRRRRSSTSLAAITPSELAQRQKEHKTAHSNIEKKRRIKMNREFEALKFLIPAIRNNLIGGSTGGESTLSNGEALYKLTVLQSTVDYIKYLHGVVLLQDQELKREARYEEDKDGFDALSFAKVDINTEQYRNLETEFNFKKLFEDYKSPNLKPTVQQQQQQQPRLSFDGYQAPSLAPLQQFTKPTTIRQKSTPTSSSLSSSVFASYGNNIQRNSSLPNPSTATTGATTNLHLNSSLSNCSSTKTTPLLSAVPSPLISPTLKGKLPNLNNNNTTASTSSLNINSFQFPLTTNSSLSYSSPLLSNSANNNNNNNFPPTNQFFQLPSSALPPIIHLPPAQTPDQQKPLENISSTPSSFSKTEQSSVGTRSTTGSLSPHSNQGRAQSTGDNYGLVTTGGADKLLSNSVGGTSTMSTGGGIAVNLSLNELSGATGADTGVGSTSMASNSSLMSLLN